MPVEDGAPHSGAALLRRTSVLGRWPKILAQGEFTSPEHLNQKGRRRPLAAETQKEGHDKGYSSQGHLEINPRMTD